VTAVLRETWRGRVLNHTGVSDRHWPRRVTVFVVNLGVDPTAIDEAAQCVELGEDDDGLHQFRQRPVVFASSQFLQIVMTQFTILSHEN